MSQLILYLPPNGAHPSALLDYVLSPDGSTVAAHARVPLSLLPASAQHEVVLVLPAQALSWHAVKLPPGSLPRQMLGERGSTRLRTILEGLLEDQLLDEPAQLHLALQPQAVTGEPVWVVATARDAIHAALKALADAGHEVGRIVPELSVSALADHLYVTEQASGAQLTGLLRADATDSKTVLSDAVLVCPLTPESVALLEPAAMAGRPTPAHQGAGTAATMLRQVVAEPAVSQLAEQLFRRPVLLQQRAQRLLQAAQSPWDLAQFDLAHARRDRRRALWSQALRSVLQAPAWRAARWSLLALVAVNLIGLNAWALREQAKLQAQRAQIRAVLTQTFPKIPVVVDAPLQMARELALLQQTRARRGGADVEGLLSSFSALAPVGYAPTAIEYVADEVRLTGPGLAPEQQQQLIRSLQSRGLKVSLQADTWLLSAGGRP
jgi:general secretion pathway protein L